MPLKHGLLDVIKVVSKSIHLALFGWEYDKYLMITFAIVKIAVY